MKKRCCIISAATINDYDRIRSYIESTDYIIYCDAGLNHREHLNAAPDLIIGDFDSYAFRQFDTETIVLPHVKDDTDTFFAVKEGLKRGFKDFLLLGCIGNRLDHSMGNISSLLYLFNHDAHGLIVDDYSEMEIVSASPVTVSYDFPYFSLVNVDGDAHGITVSGALYELEDADLYPDYPLGVSNEPLPGRVATITVKEGKLLLMRIFDR